MASVSNDLLSDIAKRCSISDTRILAKSKELLNLLNSKCKLTCPEMCKAVICLELACVVLNSATMSKENAVKYSGCKKSVYMNQYNNMAKLLNLDKVYSVRDVCFCLGISEVQDHAAKLLAQYRTEHSDFDLDWEHPMYSCAAVWLSCRRNKVKINSSKLVELSRLKKIELEELVVKLKKSIEESEVCTKVRKQKRNIVELQDVKLIGGKEPVEAKKVMSEDYNDWKKRMLADD